MNLSINQAQNQISFATKALNPIGFLASMAAVARQRRTLSELPEHLLRDIGINKTEAEREASRAPWDAPATWRR